MLIELNTSMTSWNGDVADSDFTFMPSSHFEDLDAIGSFGFIRPQHMHDPARVFLESKGLEQ